MSELDERPLHAALIALLRDDSPRMALLAAVAALDLPDGWIAAGFVRAAVWDHLHGRAAAFGDDDVDVVWFDPARAAAAHDRALEAALAARAPSVRWSVKNQARMHARNGDAPYASTADALRQWPETATAVAARVRPDGVEILAPFGLADLFALRLRPPPAASPANLVVFDERVRAKRWLERWPQLRLAAP